MQPLEFRTAADIARPPEAVFAFLRDIDQLPRDAHSTVPVLEKTTPGPYGVGSRFREVVRVLPFAKAEVVSVVTRFDPPRELGYRFNWHCLGARIGGELHYHLDALPTGGTRLVQDQTLEPRWPLRAFARWIDRSFRRRIDARMHDVKAAIEESLG